MKDVYNLWIERGKAVWPYLWPWVLGPILIIHVAALGETLLTCVRLAAFLYISGLALLFGLGMFLGIITHAPNSILKSIDSYNFSKITPIRWGYDLVNWLVFENEEVEDADQAGGGGPSPGAEGDSEGQADEDLERPVDVVVED